MQANGATESQIDSVMNATGRENPLMESTVRQATLDSMAYRDLFNGTKLAKDSKAVADFNALAARMKTDSMETDNRFIVHDEIVTKTSKEGISQEAIDNLDFIDEYTDGDLTAEEHVAKRQYMADREVYAKFFADRGLMKGDFEQKYDSITNVIRP